VVFEIDPVLRARGSPLLWRFDRWVMKRRSRRWWPRSTPLTGASNALQLLKSLSDDVVALKEAAVVVQGADGKLQIKESHHVATGAVVGAIVGASAPKAAQPAAIALTGPTITELERKLRMAVGRRHHRDDARGPGRPAGRSNAPAP
jgi:hypothetical protein